MFVSPDPLLLEGTINPRDYVENPFAQMDPTGLFNPAPNQSPTQQDGQGTGGGQFPRTPSAANGQPRPGLPTGNQLTDPKGTYLTTPGAYATNGSNNSAGQWVPGYANVPPGFNPQAQGGWPKPLQQQVDNAGYTHGCHSCGSTAPGPNGHFTPDHQPQQSGLRPSKERAAHERGGGRCPAGQSGRGLEPHVRPGYNAKGPVPPAQNAGDNRYLGGQSYNNWR